MEYELKAGSDDLLRPIHYFPGDEHVPVDTYQRCINKSYMSTVATVTGAAEGCGLDIDSETFERWKRVLSAMDFLDDLLDESPDRQLAQGVYRNCLDYLADDTEAATALRWADDEFGSSVYLLKNSIAPLPVARQKSLVNSAARIGQIAPEKVKSADVKKYAELLREEGHLTAGLLTETASDHVYLQDGFSDFKNWITYTTIWANIMCCSRDLKSDIETGNTKVEYGLVNRARIAWYSGRLAVATTGAKPNRRASFSSVRARLKFGIRMKK